MRYAVISDVHANLEALAVVLADIDARRPDAVICLGDFVGYGPDPVACVERLRPLVAGAVAGNHDLAVLGDERVPVERFNPYAHAAVVWTRERMTPGAAEYLRGLPYELHQSAFLAVHGSPRDPVEEYLLDAAAARASFRTADFHLCLVGHTHVPGVFTLEGNRVTATPLPIDEPLDLHPGARYILNAGSVGQPRDGDPRAAYLWLDEGRGQALLIRLTYPIEQTQGKMLAAGLPPMLAERLAYGR